MPSLQLPSRRNRSGLHLFRWLLISLFLGIAVGRHDTIRDTSRFQLHGVENISEFDRNDRTGNGNSQRNRNRNRNRKLDKGQYYEFLDGDGRTSTTTLSDVWLCLACALGWSIWLVSTRQPPQQLVFEQQESSKAMGHVLQVSLGESILGTGIPVYYALIDYVVEGDTDEEHIQVRKVFTSKKLLEEGFANVEVLYLTDDPTTAILMDDLLDQKAEREFQAPHSTFYYVVIYCVSVVLIGISVYGGIRMASRLEHPIYGWISLAVGLLLLYPAAILLYRLVHYLYSLAGPLTERPGVIVHGKRLLWAKQCHGTLNPLEILGGDRYRDRDRKIQTDRAIELSDLQVPKIHNTRGRNRKDAATTPKLFPNAGCGFGNFNVHLPIGRQRASSSVSSIGASASTHSESQKGTGKIVRNDTSILEKYELHVTAFEKIGL